MSPVSEKKFAKSEKSSLAGVGCAEFPQGSWVTSKEKGGDPMDSVQGKIARRGRSERLDKDEYRSDKFRNECRFDKLLPKVFR